MTAAALLRHAQVAAPGTRQVPVDRGERLATVARSDSGEVRVSWDSDEGRLCLSIRLWTRNARGEWWPDKAQGISVRVRELADFAAAVEAALDGAPRRVVIP
jgi:hypothetical protein